MVNFKELKYVRPDFKKAKDIIVEFAMKAKEAEDLEKIKCIIKDFKVFYCDIETNIAIAFIRAYLDSDDEYYNTEMQQCMQERAMLDFNEFYNVLLDSRFAGDIDKIYGEQFLMKLRDSILINSNGMELMGKEQQLVTQYQ